MDKFVKTLFTEDIIEKVVSLYGIKKDELYLVGGFENYVYGFDKNEKSYIVRITHSSHRSLEEVKAEIDFIFYLAKNGANVSMPIYTVNQLLVESIECVDHSYFIVSAFTKAEGEAPTRQNATNKMFYNYGKTVGLFHKLTKGYKESPGIQKRDNWDQDLLIIKAKDYLSSEDSIILDRLSEVINEINTFEKNNDNFGLIHTDIHIGNFFVKNDELTVFDFDDSSYQYFASDLAIALFYLIFMRKEEEQYEFADNFMTYFMKGYLDTNVLPKSDYLKIPVFLKLREIIIYIVLFKTVDIKESKFAQEYIKRYRDRIINRIPFIQLDLNKYYNL